MKKALPKMLSAVLAAAALALSLAACEAEKEDTETIAESIEISAAEKADITDAEIKKLIKKNNFITLYTEYESLSFDQNETAQWQEREYYKVNDERFDEWDEWVEYIRSVYVENSEREEFILTKSHYISVDGFNFTDGGGMGCTIAFDQYAYEMVDPVDGRPVCKVKMPDLSEGSEGNFYVETITFENTSNGWRIYDAVQDYENNKN